MKRIKRHTTSLTMPFLFLLFLLGTAVLPSPAFALASDWQKDEAASVRLISGVDGVGQETTIPLGLDIQLAPEWHTYWRSPGAAGLPPSLNWVNSQTESGNLQEAVLQYPAPRRYTAYGLETVGYRDHVVLPVMATVKTAGKALQIDATLDLLVCSAICVPKNYNLKLTVPEGEAKPSAEADLIKDSQEQIPGNAEKSGMVLKSIVNTGDRYKITVESRFPLREPDIFIENDKNVMFGAPVVTANEDMHSILFDVKPVDTLPTGTKLGDLQLVLTVVNDDHALEQKIAAPPATEVAAEKTASTMPLQLAILFALIGGFILNLMPCVLPVLSLKILSVVSHGGGDKATVRISFLMTAAGIMFSFLVLAGMTILLKELGLTLGWGVQFQQPAFLMVLVIILTFFAANLWGLLEVQLPQWLADNLNEAAYHPKMAGDFATGTFATLLATPCTAPFLGTAVGFALASGPVDILVIFAALGMGMILPYVAIAIFPRIATIFPKPGAWMVKLRGLLGFALAATAVWLVWVLAAQITVRYATVVGLCMAGIVILLALKKTSVSKRLIRLGILDFVIVAMGLTLAGSLMPKSAAQVESHWLPLNERVLAADVEEGKTVFVDITADWCLTCKANKKFILSQTAISERLFNSDIIAMQADWTNPDPDITEFLHKYGRYGIPFNAVFGPGAPEGIVLPELLTPDSVMNALDKASTKPRP